MDIYEALDGSAQHQLLLLWDLDDKLANEIIHKLLCHQPVNPSAYVVSCVKHARHRACSGPCSQARCYILTLFCVSLLELGETAAGLTSVAVGTVSGAAKQLLLFVLRFLVSRGHTCSFANNEYNEPCIVLNARVRAYFVTLFTQSAYIC